MFKPTGLDRETMWREIELLHRRQQQTVQRMLEDPDDEKARVRYRIQNAFIVALRMRIANTTETLQ